MTPDSSSHESVLVLGVKAKASIPILETCSALGLRVVAGSEIRHCSGFYSRATDERLLYPSPVTEPDACREFLLDYLSRNEISVLFPTGDEMTEIVSLHQDEFRKHTRLVVPPFEAFRQGRSKILTLKAAQRVGCPIPHTWYIDEMPLEQIAAEAMYPVLVKPAVSSGARGMLLCHQPDELREAFPRVEKAFGDSFVQEYIPQDGMQYKVDMVLDERQELLAAVAYAKLRYYPPDGGSSVLNRTEWRPDIVEDSRKVAAEIGWVGLCDFDFITDSRDGVVKLMEINPRFPESYRATIAAGVDMTEMLYRMAKGEQVEPQLHYEENRYLRFLFGDLMWYLTTEDDRWETHPPFFELFRGDMLYQLLRSNDPGIFFGYVMENLSMLAGRWRPGPRAAAPPRILSALKNGEVSSKALPRPLGVADHLVQHLEVEASSTAGSP